MAKLTLNTIGSRYGSVDALNDNFNAIEAAIENTLSRDGTGPNALEANLDMNGQAILNASTINASTLIIGGQTLEPGDAVAAATVQVFEFTATAGQTSFSVSPLTPTSSSVLMEVNGLSLPTSSLVTTGSTLSFPALTLGDEVVVKVFTREIGAYPAITNNEVATNAAIVSSKLAFTQAGTGAQVRAVQDKMRESVSVFDFMTAAQIADAQAYTYALDLTAPIQSAMNAAYASSDKLFFPSGGYKVTGLTIPGTNNSAGKAHKFLIYGEGFGEAGIIAAKNAGSFLYSTTNAPIFKYTQTAAANGSGEVEISNFAMWGTSATYVVDLDTFYGLCSLHHCNIVQSGTGGGVRIGWGATYEIHNNYICGASYAVPNGLGALRTGIGIYLEQNPSSGALQSVRKTTVAGWNTCIKVGQGGTVSYAYSVSIDTCEVAYFWRGVHLTDNAEGATITKTYFEGQDQGIGVLDEGNFNTVERTWHFFNGGSCTFIDATAISRMGGRYINNVFYAFNGANTVCVDVASISGRTKTVSDNTFLQLAGTAGVIGIRMTGANARIYATGNSFSPDTAWTGAGSAQVINNTTSSDGTIGSGNYALSASRSITGAVVGPALGRGSVNLAVDSTVLNNTNIAAGVLTLGELSVYTLTPTGSVAITSFAAPNLPDKTFSIHVTATAFAVTFTNGALLKLAGSANLVTGANGCWISFQIKAGGIAYETSRVVY